VIQLNEEKSTETVREESNEEMNTEVNAEVKAEANEETNPESTEPAEEQSAVALLEKELEETKNRYLRLHADFDNFRKRTQKEKEEWYQYASMNIIEKLLPVVDNFERALISLDSQSEEVQSMLAGMKMIYRQLTEILQKEGLEPIPAVGESFDPNIHEAIMQVTPEEGQADGQVVEELRKGYRFKDRVLRPTLVKVAKN